MNTPGTNLTGLGRLESNKDKNEFIYEGFFLNSKRNGFGRCIEDNGDYYVGYWKDNAYHGHGIKVYLDGSIK